MTSTTPWARRTQCSGVAAAGLGGVHLAAIAAAALAIGVLIYLSDRDAARVLLMPTLPTWTGGPRFGVLGLWLPSFLHTFAFSLFTVALLPRHTRWRVGACLAWGGVNVLFEIGQHPQLSGPLAQLLQSGLGEGRVSAALAGYFLRGTFDLGDIAAAVLGAVAAMALMRLRLNILETPHAR